MKRALFVVVGLGALSIPGASQAQADRRPVSAVVSVVRSDATADSLRALDRLHQYGYTINTQARAERAIRHWQSVNGLTVDGVVGPETLASLHLDPLPPAVAGSTAEGPDQRRGSDPAPAGDIETLIRDMWPDELEDRAVQIAMRESRLQPAVINRNGNATGLFQIMWTVHRGWLCPQLGICQQSDLQDATLNTKAAIALYNRAGGFGPWSL